MKFRNYKAIGRGGVREVLMLVGGLNLMVSAWGADFPTGALMPKAETGAAAFLEAHPEYDGRGVTVAIFDTGVDPGAEGLQTTPDGRPKIVELVDASGSGDVVTETVVTVEDGVINGLTGRELTIDPEWTNPSGSFHVGMKSAWELFPSELVARLREERRPEWERRQWERLTSISKELVELKHDESLEDDVKQERLEEIEARKEHLEEMISGRQDPGPIYDCVVFNDGETWRAVVDTDEDGDLRDEKVLASYGEEQEHATFGEPSLMNFGVNVYEEGRLLSIVVDSGMHGTHVAGIVGANYPDQPELNGVAPGVQIVSIKIGDTRIDGMETGTGIQRGLIEVLKKHRCDLINMSYGEPTRTPDQGELIDLISEVVNEHQVIFVASAGNDGPALSSVGAPGGTTSSIIGVGAYLTPEMMATNYSILNPYAGLPYTWSSRGPTFDGALGVDITAPGGAFSPVPAWTLQRNMHANGTSMSSPNACGGIALLISALKQEEIAYSPALVKRAIENSAEKLPDTDVFSQGNGMLRVDRAYEYFQQEGLTPSPYYEIQPRGVYLRDVELDEPIKRQIRVTPQFRRESPNAEKLPFNQRFLLQSSAEWLRCPEFLFVTNQSHGFEVEVSAQDLESGVHFAQIEGIDSARPELGPIFRIPVTVIRPHESEEVEDGNDWRDEIRLEPGQVERRFLKVPEGANIAELVIRPTDLDYEQFLLLHALQTLPGENHRDGSTKLRLRMEPNVESVERIALEGGHVVELCFAAYWTSLSSGEYDVSVRFHGLIPSDDDVTLEGDHPVAEVNVTSLRAATLSPSGTLNRWRRSVKPSEANLRVLPDDRDRLPNGQPIHELVLEYAFSVEEGSSVTPLFPAINYRLYEATLQSHLWMIFDENKKRMAVDDGWDPHAVSLEEGKYTLRYHLRHEDPEVLEKLKDLPVLLDTNLSNSLQVSAAADPEAAWLGDRGFEQSLAAGESAQFYFVGPNEGWPSFVNPGDRLLGQFSLSSEDRPGGFPLSLVVPNSGSASGSGGGDSSEDLSIEEQIIELKVKALEKLNGEEQNEAFDALAREILEERPNHLGVLTAKLHRIDQVEVRKENPEEVVEAADAVIDAIDKEELIKQQGTKVLEDDDEGKAAKKEAEENREILADALYRKARAIAFGDGSPEENGVPENPEPFENAYRELQRWVDVDEHPYVLVKIRRERRNQHFGKALKLVDELIEKRGPEKMLIEKRITLLEALEWDDWAKEEARVNLERFPDEFPPF